MNPQCSKYVGASWAAASTGAVNDYYLGNRLTYGPVDASVAGIVTPEMVFAFFAKALAAWLVCLAVSVLIVAFTAASGDWQAGLILSALVFLGSFYVFFIPFRTPVSGWHFVVDDKAAAADSAFAQIYTALRRRNSPIEVEPRRITGGLHDRKARNYLRLRQGQFATYVSVFSYGRDLFVGWTMWWEIRPLTMLSTFLVRQAGATLFEVVVRSDEAQAFREVVHSATREGVDVANLGIEVPIATTFGSELITETEPTMQ